MRRVALMVILLVIGLTLASCNGGVSHPPLTGKVGDDVTAFITKECPAANVNSFNATIVKAGFVVELTGNMRVDRASEKRLLLECVASIPNVSIVRDHIAVSDG